MHRIAAMALVLATVFIALPAHAQDNAKDAQTHFQKGAEWYTQGEYSKAIVEFHKGHAIAPNAMFLYNISLAYGKLGNFEDALSAAQKAKNEEGMPAKVALRNEARIASFVSMLSAQNVATQIAAIPEATEPRVEVQPAEGGMGALGWTGVGLTVIGAGLATGAIIIGSGLSDDLDSLKVEAAGGDRVEYDRLRSDLEDGQSTGQLLLYSGAGLATAGLVMIIIDLASGDESDSVGSISPIPGGMQASWRLEF